MSRLFVPATSDVLNIDSPPVTSYPLTMACWFYSTNTNLNQAMMYLGDKDVSTHKFLLRQTGDAAGDKVYFSVRAGGTQQDALVSVVSSYNTWEHACGVAASATSRTVYRNGTNSGSNTVSVTPSGIDRFSIGRQNFLSGSDSTFQGMIAHAAIWSVALTAAEVALLAAGVNPTKIQRANLVSYYPLYGYASPESDLIGGYDLTVTGATQDVDSPTAPPFQLSPIGVG